MLTATLFRAHRCDIWREAETLNADGTRAAPTWSRIATAVPCRFQTGESVKAPQGFIRTEEDNLFTLDLIHFNSDVSVGEGDVLVQTTGDEPGNYWTVRGDPQIRNLLAGKLSVRASRTPDVHTIITEAY